MKFLLRIKIFIYLIFCLFFSLHSFAEVKPVFKQKLSLNGIINSPSEVSLSPDGTKIFFTVFATNKFEQYTLTVPFDISSLDTSTKIQFDLNAGDDDIVDAQGHAFNSDGTKFFVVSKTAAATQLNAHSLSRPYDLSSDISQIADDGIAWRTAFSAGDGSVHAHDITFNNNGTKMYLLDTGHNSAGDGGVVEYDLSIPYDTSSASFVNELVTSDVLSLFEQDIEFDDDGTRMYVIDSSNVDSANVKIAVYKLSNPYHTSSATFVGSIANFFDGSGDARTPLGLSFSSDGMKLYQVTYHNTGAGVRDALYEYDLSCPYGIVICEGETVSNTSGQVEFAKNVINQNSSTIFKRFEWIRRNDNKNYNSNNINIKNNNPLLAALTNKLQSNFGKKIYKKVSLNNEVETDKNKWSSWTHGDISFGRLGDTILTDPREIRSSGIMFGKDKKVGKDTFVGLAVRYGRNDTDYLNPNETKLDGESFSLNFYGTAPISYNSHLNALIGASLLRMDQIMDDTIAGERNGQQIFTAFSLKSKKGYGKFNITPTGKVQLGITKLSSYTDFGTSSTNSIDSYETLIFRNGTVETGFNFDNTIQIDIGKLSRNGSIEYVADLSPDIDYSVTNNADGKLLVKTVETHSRHNVRGNIGFEVLLLEGGTFAVNYERFQGLNDSSHQESIFLKFSRIREDGAELALNFNPLENNETELSYTTEVHGYNLSLNSNYKLMSKVDDYYLNLEISNTF